MLQIMYRIQKRLCLKQKNKYYKKGNNDKVKIITKETSFVKDVYVIDKKNNKPASASLRPDGADLQSV